MDKEIKNETIEEFNKKLEALSKNYYPDLPTVNLGLMVIYEKLNEIEKKLKETPVSK